jgi:hypothetical protein
MKTIGAPSVDKMLSAKRPEGKKMGMMNQRLGDID